MEPLAPPVARLIDALARLPGIGPKTASRLAFFLLRAPDEMSQTLAQALQDLKTQTLLCAECFNVAETSVADADDEIRTQQPSPSSTVIAAHGS